MATENPDPNSGSAESSPAPQRPSRRKPLTPELRRFLGPGRSWREREAAREEAEATGAIESAPEPGTADSPPPDDWAAPPEPIRQPAATSDRPRSTSTPAAVVPDQRISRVLEMQTLAIVIGLLILLGASFYAGTKIRYLKAFLSSRQKPEMANLEKKYPGLSADELVEQALAAERLGHWHEAAERLLVAKRRNVLQRGLVFHAAKLCYDHGDFETADRLLERAIAFGDQVDTANYLRGLIAVGRNDLPAAEHFFQAAINAEPFTPGYYYYLGEALRRDHKSKDAAVRYEQAAARTINESDATLCRFKARMAKIETADRPQLQTEVDRKRAAGPLSVDWILTDAALRLRAGEITEAAQLIRQARTGDEHRLAALFASCTSDILFTEAANKHPEIAEVCRLGVRPNALGPNPFAAP